MKFYNLLLLLLFFGMLSSQAQDVNNTVADTLEIRLDPEVKEHSPKKATLMSMALPGLGQAYNKKYWKIPVAYALIATPLYFAIDQQKQFKNYKSAYLQRIDPNPNVTDPYEGIYTEDNLINLVDFHRRNRDLFYVLTAVAYVLNVVDAAVDAHLYYFNVSDDISGLIKPDFQYLDNNTLAPSLTLNLTFGQKPLKKSF